MLVTLMIAGSGCSARKPMQSRFNENWNCDIQAVNARSGEPTQMLCTGKDGRKYLVRAQ